MRDIDLIVVHCADTPPSMDIGVAEIREWHKQKGWRDVGYHWVIRRNGGIEPGRPKANVGAHVKGHNKHSLGICLVGRLADDFTPPQWTSLAGLVRDQINAHPRAKVIGHRDLDPHKTCPGFDVAVWWDAVQASLAGRY